ncbi:MULTISPECIES: hypothetical protein [Bacillus subtilis group]|nr:MULTISPECIES: hypothetical protein [Bacillus subtilis group]ARC67319.1 hypothetical protein B14_200108 [Bacillus licheniformis]ARW46040.1 hypothetical protein S100141_04820 [Bacillus licheniformis]MDE1421972.1 hypothetical protein [Bacillus licheniformis]MEC0475977.1 hypothetical protein [Bacillus licheniformis]MED4337850.1 hypothetical protein [Bacillus licheniformis]
MFYSVHIYGGDVQLQKMKAKSSIEAKNEILEQMKGINFKSDEDKVLIFDMQEEPEGKAIFDYEEYLEEQKARKDA